MSIIQPIYRLCGGALFSLLIVSSSASQEPYDLEQMKADQLTMIEIEQYGVRAFQNLNYQREQLWQFASLAIKSIELVQNVEGFGRFSRREGREFRASDKLLLYIEPLFYTNSPVADEFHINLTADLALITDSGLVLSDMPSIAEFHSKSKSKNFRYYFTLAITIPDALKPGEYLLRVTVRDQETQETSWRFVPISLLGGT